MDLQTSRPTHATGEGLGHVEYVKWSPFSGAHTFVFSSLPGIILNISAEFWMIFLSVIAVRRSKLELDLTKTSDHPG